MSINLARNSCTGCTACAEVCPKHCITLSNNREGFLYPEINTSICIECGLCERTCPVLHKPKQKGIMTVAYAAYSTDEKERLSSSSGGIFSLLVNIVLDNGGIVYGAAFDERFNVKHVGIETKEGLSKLRGSKYVQSDLGNVFSEVKTALENGRQVLFSGTICQIAGIKAFLKKDYPNLLAVDVLCHGVPSPKVWKKYLDELENKYGSKVKRMTFRHKKYGWKSYALSFEFTNDNAYESVFYKDPYMQMFLRNICLRPSCYACQFNEVDRLSDITLGDCWGINNTMPDMDDDKGTSVVLVHTEKGKAWFEKIKQNMVIRESDVDTILPPMSGGRHSVASHPKREKFFELLNQDASIDSLAKLVKEPLVKKSIRFGKTVIKRILK